MHMYEMIVKMHLINQTDAFELVAHDNTIYFVSVFRNNSKLCTNNFEIPEENTIAFVRFLSRQ